MGVRLTGSGGGAGGAPTENPTFTGVVTVPDGSVSAPSLTNTGDSNSGLYFGAADQTGFAVGGTAGLSCAKVGSYPMTLLNPDSANSGIAHLVWSGLDDGGTMVTVARGDLASKPYIFYSSESGSAIRLEIGRVTVVRNTGGGAFCSNSDVKLGVNATTGNDGDVCVTVDANKNIIMGDGALATNATNGFMFIAGGAGAPSGTPAATPTGRYALYYDSTNNKIYIYDGGWISTAALT